jgi:DNA-binding LacI/PurR family transcriptional regulator
MKKGIKKEATLKEIARACRVSIMTVSRAFKEGHLLKPATLEVILKTAAQKGYQPDGMMGRPRRRNTDTRRTAQVVIEMNIDSGTSLFHAHLLGVIEKALAQKEHDCLLRTYDGSYHNFVWLSEILRSNHPCPTMFIGNFHLNHLQTLLKICPSALLVDYSENPHLTCAYNSIGFDNVEAARLAVRHLLAQGRRKILLLKGHPNHFFSRDIERGYREVFQINKLRINETLIVNSDFTPTDACQIIKRLIKSGVKFDAVFTNDEMAMGVIKALRECDRIVPDDVAVCGCDGLPFGVFLSPALSTVILDYAELGKAAVDKLILPHGKTAMPERIKLVPRLEIRESTGKRRNR